MRVGGAHRGRVFLQIYTISERYKETQIVSIRA